MNQIDNQVSKANRTSNTDAHKHFVSVIIPFYNREKLLARAIKSVLNQTYENWELILIDDGSTDNSADVAQAFCKLMPGSIRLIRQQNVGSGAARNVGIKLARGEFVAFLDSDDMWHTNLLESGIEPFDHCPELEWLCYNARRIESSGKTIVPSVFDRIDGKDFRNLKCEKVGKLNLIKDNNYLYVAITSTVKAGANSIIRRQVFDHTRFNPEFPGVVDRLFSIEAISRGVIVGYINDILLDVYMHGDNISIPDQYDYKKQQQLQRSFIRLCEYVSRRIVLNKHEKRGLNKRLGNLYVSFGYKWIINGKNFLHGLYYLAKGILYNPMNPYLWKSGFACIVKRIISMVSKKKWV